MEKKRAAESEPDESDNHHPPKQARPSSPEEIPSQQTRGSPQAKTEASPEVQEESLPKEPDNDELITYQRSQLAARIVEQHADISWLRAKVSELQNLVSVLDAAPQAALYHMCAVREDLTLTLARLAIFTENDDMSECPIAATLLDAEVVTNESLGEIPAAVKKLTAHIILAMENNSTGKKPDPERRAANDELHRRVRQVSDQLERYAERDKESLVASTNINFEIDNLRDEVSAQRRKIVSLENRLRSKQDKLHELSIKNVDDDDSKTKSEAMVTSGSQRGEGPVSESVKQVAESRLQELQKFHEENAKLLSELESLRAEITRRDANVVPIKTILGTALYQTMEATLQQLYLKEKTWQKERDAQNEEIEAERKDAKERLEQANTKAEKNIEDLRRQLDEFRRVADSAKVEKDRVVMTYEARKVEAGNAGAVIAAAEERAKVSDEMREKLVKTKKSLVEEVALLRTRLRELEDSIKDSQVPDTQRMIEQMQQAADEERAKTAEFIREAEELSEMFGELESENKGQVKLLAEKEQFLNKVMAERLRIRQLLSTVREENRQLIQKRDQDSEKIKALMAAVTASKTMSDESLAASNKAQEEARALASALEKRRRIADDASVSARAAQAENEELKRERDAYKVRAEQVLLEHKDDKFQSKRLRERLEECERKLKETEENLEREVAKSRQAAEEHSIRDEIIRDQRKKLNCSIVTSEQKQVVLLRCGHLFSRQCTDNLISTRNRKCPICGKPFGNDDVRNVFF